MQYSKYLGHEQQLSGVEEHRLVGGKGDGMRLLEVRNGKGLECTVSADRCADLPLALTLSLIPNSDVMLLPSLSRR